MRKILLSLILVSTSVFAQGNSKVTLEKIELDGIGDAYLQAIIFESDGSLLISANYDGKGKLWKLTKSGKVQLVTDDQKIILGDKHTPSKPQFYELRKFKIDPRSAPGGGAVYDVAVGPDGTIYWAMYSGIWKKENNKAEAVNLGGDNFDSVTVDSLGTIYVASSNFLNAPKGLWKRNATSSEFVEVKELKGQAVTALAANPIDNSLFIIIRDGSDASITGLYKVHQ